MHAAARMMVAALAAARLVAPAPLLAQEPPRPTPETLLHLSATGTVQAPPDQLVAELIAQSTAAAPADAQRNVNAQMNRGLQAAKAVPAVETRALDYEVSPSDEKRTRWTAQQTLELLGSDASPLLDLANKLQEQGFVTASLDWRLSPGARRKADDDATILALKTLQDQAAAAAAALGLHVAYIKDVQIQPHAFRPARPVGVMMAARMDAPAPTATAAPQDVSVEVSAEIVLH